MADLGGIWGKPAEHREDPPPPVEVYARRASPEEIPSAARRFTKLPGVHGRARYARGPIRVRDGWKIVDSVMLQLVTGERLANAVWIDGKFSIAMAHQVGKVNATELKAYLTEDRPDLVWLVDTPLRRES